MQRKRQVTSARQAAISPLVRVVLRRQAPKQLRLLHTGRLFWVMLSRIWTGWRQAVQIVTPDTVVAWHRRGLASYWHWRCRPRGTGRPPVAQDIRDLIRRMQTANPLWGAPRIHPELQKLGIAAGPSAPPNRGDRVSGRDT